MGQEVKVKVSAEVYIDIDGLDPKFVDIDEFVKDEARRIMINEPEFYEFKYSIEKYKKGKQNETCKLS